MKLMRFGKTGEERPGIELNNGQQLDVSAFGEDFNQFFLQKIVLPNLPYGWKDALVKFECCPITNYERLGHPFDNPWKMVCVWPSYAKHFITSLSAPERAGIIGENAAHVYNL